MSGLRLLVHQGLHTWSKNTRTVTQNAELSATLIDVQHNPCVDPTTLQHRMSNVRGLSKSSLTFNGMQWLVQDPVLTITELISHCGKMFVESVFNLSTLPQE